MPASISLLILLVVVSQICLAFLAIYIISVWKLYVKAGTKGWYCFIPFYGNWVYGEIAGKPGWMGLLAALSVTHQFQITSQSSSSNTNHPISLHPLETVLITGIVLYFISFGFQILVSVGLARNFAKDNKYAVLIILFPFVMIPVLALGQSQYNYQKQKASRKLVITGFLISGITALVSILFVIYVFIPLLSTANQNHQALIHEQTDIYTISYTIQLYEKDVSPTLPQSIQEGGSNYFNLCGQASCQTGITSYLLRRYQSSDVKLYDYSTFNKSTEINNDTVAIITNGQCNSANSGLVNYKKNSIAILYSQNSNHCLNVPYQRNNNTPTFCGNYIDPKSPKYVTQLSLLLLNLDKTRYSVTADLKNNNYYPTQTDLTETINADDQLISGIQKISFPRNIQPSVNTYISNVNNYDQLLNTELNNFHDPPSNLNSQLITARNDRESSFSALGLQLQISPSTCLYDIP